ncbi:galactokinase [compost metagenome]
MELERVVFTLRRSGAVGAKLTGAGWGGSVIALVGEELVDRVRENLSSLVKSIHDVDIGVEGARLEE